MSSKSHSPETFIKSCGVSDPERLATLCRRYFELLTFRNRDLNLTRISSESDFWLKHVCDSLAIARYFPEIAEEPLDLLDLGCGAGFPAFVLAAAFSALRVTGMDSTRKKIAFVESAAAECGVTARWIAARGCELARKSEWRRKFDFITARAVGDASKVVSEVREMLRSGGELVLYQTPRQTAALDEATLPAGFVWKITSAFELPESVGERCFLAGKRV